MKILIGLFLIATAILALSAQAEPKNLLTGMVQVSDAEQVAFTLSGENRKDVIGGTIKLGERIFTIDRISRQGMIGASRSGSHSDGRQGSYAEFAVFSSSFNEQTATGQPWAAGKIYVNCDQAYNSFLAIYRLHDGTAAAAFDRSPYPTLLEDVAKSDDSAVYCFNSKPPA